MTNDNPDVGDEEDLVDGPVDDKTKHIVPPGEATLEDDDDVEDDDNNDDDDLEE